MKRFFKCESGATAIEYALIAGLISIAAVAAMTQLGSKVNSSFSNTANSW